MSLDYLNGLINISPVTVVSTVLVILLAILYFLRKDKDSLPGPTGLPIIGYWPFLNEDDIHLQLNDLKTKYGAIYSISVTGKVFIHLGSIKSIKEALIKKSDCFMERSTDYGVLNVIFEKGVIAENGEKWKTLRSFFIQAFKEHGLRSIEGLQSDPNEESFNTFIENLKITSGMPTNIIPLLNHQALCIFRRFMFNDDEITEEDLKGVLESYQNVLTIVTGKKMLLMGEFARYFIFPRIGGYRLSLENQKKMKEHLTVLVQRHEKSYSEGRVRDVVDSFIKERKERNEKGDPSAEYYSEESLVCSLIQLVGDGILGISIFIAYFIYALLEYPEEQEKIYKEIIDVEKADGKITPEESHKLPYTNAFLQEVMRTTDFFTILPSLVCTKETTVGGYKIPKGAIALINLWSAQRDPETFEEPDAFKPSRYLNEPGRKVAESPIIFGVGKRSCAGENFTMMQVFLFVTNIVKNFRLERPEGEAKRNFLDGQMDLCAYPRM